MNNTDSKEFWFRAEGMLRVLLNESELILGEESTNSVRHYIDHSEYEMAFEGLFLELIKLNEFPKSLKLDEYIELGKSLELDSESVFDVEFWPKFMQFVSQKYK